MALGGPGQGPDPLHLVQSLLSRYGVAQAPGLPHFCGGAVGYLGYDVVRFFENLPECPDDELHLPDSAFLFSETQVVFDQVGCSFSGLCPVGSHSTSSGKVTGSWSSGTGTWPCSGQ